MSCVIYRKGKGLAQWGLILLTASLVQLPYAVAEGSTFAIGVHAAIILYWLLWFDRNVAIVLNRRKIDYIMEEYAEC